MSQDYRVYRSQFIINNQQELIKEIDRAHLKFKNVLKEKDATWHYNKYNIFSLTAPSYLFYSLFNELKYNIRDFIGTDKPLWFQSWVNYHQPDEVLDWHTHAFPYHGYISIDPKDTKTVFRGYEIKNEVGNIYLGPGYREHKVVVVDKNFKSPRITLGFDITDVPGENNLLSLIPI